VALFPAGALVHWTANAESHCALHGEACSCPANCVEQGHAHEAEKVALACHRKPAGDSAKATTAAGGTGPRWASCGTRTEPFAAGVEMPYVPTVTGTVIGLFGEQPAGSLPLLFLSDFVVVPLRPPPQA